MPITTLRSILNEFREAAQSMRDMGDKFERLIAAYLKTDPQYAELFSEVWLWMDFPHREKKTDTGIDLVAQERATGEYWAIQCKFFDPSYHLQKADIDSFFTTSGKEPFSHRMIVTTTEKWSSNAEEALTNQKTPVIRLDIFELEKSPIDWSKFSLSRPQDLKTLPKKKPFQHQEKAISDVIAGLKKADRGKLIMACGTGKTFTALKLAEKMVGQGGYVLFLAPSISLISQSLREWTAESETDLHCFAVCSDTKVGKKDDQEDIQIHDLAIPATTDERNLAKHLKVLESNKHMTVIFSTYQSIEVISKAQKLGAPAFDLVICDEAHRTTGFSLAEEVAKGEESHFIKVHDAKFLKADKRLYMTATPRIYGDESKTKAKEAEALLCSMDDEELYGKELYRLDFSEAVQKGLLSDYKVLVLAVDEGYVDKVFQGMLSTHGELTLPDAVKITGCWNGLSKNYGKNEAPDGAGIDPGHMRRAVAFSQSIKYSKLVTDLFPKLVEEYRKNNPDGDHLQCQVDHVDGTMNALERIRKLRWLKDEPKEDGNVCRILSNARCLTEGVDVPALDAVLFLNPRNSQVDVVQAVGRVMRKSPGKKYGYIILPIGIPANEAPEKALADNKKYKVVWQVLQALRAHDNRFDIKINQLDLNNTRPDQIQVIGVGGGPGDDGHPGDLKPKATQIAIPFPQIEEWKNAIYAKIVLKCGDRQYWEGWAADVAEISKIHKTRIEGLLKGAKPKHKAAFGDFLQSLKDNINPSLDQEDAIEMLSQHLITKPIFDALFENYKFTQHNPVSQAIEKMVGILEGDNLEKETARLDKFYANVRAKIRGIDNAEGKQKVIKELYEKFFQTAFKKLTDRLGIVYTPVEVVDFIIRSAEHALREEFGVGLTDKGVNILDPFTGTGTFIVRLLQNGLIKKADLQRKFKEELHANEIVLLAYYIAAINIEEAYHDLTKGSYEPFEGIVLTDTFQMSEPRTPWDEKMFPENNERVTRQKKKDIRVILGNPPYSAGASSENESNKNLNYPALDEKIEKTYVVHSTANYLKNLYDSYIRAFRWASDRIGEKGIVCYVTNGSFIDGNAMDGFRKCLSDEFTSIYCFNLRGNQRTQGEVSRKEGGKIFGSGSRAGIAITLLVKNPTKKGACELFYHDIGDYLTREQKLKIITDFDSVKGVTWTKLTPNTSHDWINQRDPAFDGFFPLGDKRETKKVLFENYSLGTATNRDFWVYNFSKKDLIANLKRMINYYNDQVEKYKKLKKNVKVEDFINNDPKNISWAGGLKDDLNNLKSLGLFKDCIVESMYRPFCKQWLYFDSSLVNRVYQLPKIFPNSKQNFAISITGIGATRDFSALMVNSIPNLHLHDTGQCFPLFTYEKGEESDTQALPCPRRSKSVTVGGPKV